MHLSGHVVTVDTVNELRITVQTKLTLTGEATKDDIKKEIETLINNYFLELKKEWEVNDSVIVRLSRIDTILLNAAGVNGQAMNIALSKFQIPILEGVVLL